MALLGQGALHKMSAELDAPVRYAFRLDEQVLPVNPLLGQHLCIEFLGAIHCTHCGRKTRKSFSQGYCYPCFTKLAQCDSCIMSPERCHYAAGTCREPAWGEQFCMTEHIVYLANSSGAKVGITRASQVPTRWIDQGASQALPILRVATRQQSGLVEDLLRAEVTDRTNWRALLKGDAVAVDLPALREQLLQRFAAGIGKLQQRFGLQAIQPLADSAVLEISYPVQAYPSKVASLDLDKTPRVEGTLLGIKGQYLILDTGVINLRKYTAYQVAISA
ncbi:DUF2797 domain-containing protein [Pseudomonas sp. N040]|uniref:DUF2797 domain-containing protein n=1 Tax=Pseudomonas sp. N040 TaxID=2785325 RepID=UPI0018A2D865|nr:DUF2797 domain-containing protein [Pseudomonas sp. N040]MBF7729281.1 DUF2797 domain-containing protein [Pseudomonas sp. N040]MBW7012921.1 DUF2797 domain-containing protein [Pseudomonas sp. N040]